MKTEKYFVASCLECNSIVLYKMELLDFNKECCIDFKNLKIIKTFNDEQEAKNYMERWKNES